MNDSDERAQGCSYVLLSIVCLTWYPAYKVGQGGSLAGFSPNHWSVVLVYVLGAVALAKGLNFFKEAKEHDGETWLSWRYVAVIVGSGLAALSVGGFLGWITIAIK